MEQKKQAELDKTLLHFVEDNGWEWRITTSTLNRLFRAEWTAEQVKARYKELKGRQSAEETP